MNFNEIFREGVTYDNIKIHKNRRLRCFSAKLIFGKTTVFRVDTVFSVSMKIIVFLKE